jgi:hypothetical protein
MKKRLLLSISTMSTLMLIASSAQALVCEDSFKDLFSEQAVATRVAEIKKPKRVSPNKGIIQQTGQDLVPGQTEFNPRAPADPFVFEDKKTGETFVYGTQVDGSGFAYLKYKSKEDFYRGAKAEIVTENVYLPNGQLLRGKEAIWDTYRLGYDTLQEAFSKEEIDALYRENNIDAGSDLYFGGIALQENGELGRWTTDNWRRRIHPMVRRNGKLEIIATPVFSPIPKGKTEAAYAGFGNLDFLPGDYIGHAYGANFKLERVNGKVKLVILTEQVTRRVPVEGGKLAEVTEIVAHEMTTPLLAKGKGEVIVSLNGKDGKPHPDSSRGPKMGNTFLIEGPRVPTVELGGLKVQYREVIRNGKSVLVKDSSLAKDEYSVIVMSQSNFAGDGYDVIVAARKGGVLGPHKIIENGNGHWTKHLEDIKPLYGQSWAGRAALDIHKGRMKMPYHAVEKAIRPDGSYNGVIPGDTEKYHRNIYTANVVFYVDVKGEIKMKVVL